jgi:hypothetical protein
VPFECRAGRRWSPRFGPRPRSKRGSDQTCNWRPKCHWLWGQRRRKEPGPLWNIDFLQKGKRPGVKTRSSNSTILRLIHPRRISDEFCYNHVGPKWHDMINSHTLSHPWCLGASQTICTDPLWDRMGSSPTSIKNG